MEAIAWLYMISQASGLCTRVYRIQYCKANGSRLLTVKRRCADAAMMFCHPFSICKRDSRNFCLPSPGDTSHRYRFLPYFHQVYISNIRTPSSRISLNWLQRSVQDRRETWKEKTCLIDSRLGCQSSPVHFVVAHISCFVAGRS